jgi:CDP-diacylglycerol---glycerol-3-phosphate 3-phosphatidyltransferase
VIPEKLLERLAILAPAVILAGLVFAGFGVYCVMCLLGRRPQVADLEHRRFTELFGPFLVRYCLWVLSPFEWAAAKLRLKPNTITLTSLLVCGGAGAAVAYGRLATAAWLYILAGMLDILDGRLARRTNQQSKAGAFLDSVADRWGELAVFSGLAWLLRGSPWLPVVMFTVAGSVMVSYTRARGEALGITLDGGTMQRAERIALVSIGLLCASFFNVSESTRDYGDDVIGVALLTVALASTATAIHRWIQGYRILRAREEGAAEREPARELPREVQPPTLTISSKHRPAA